MKQNLRQILGLGCAAVLLLAAATSVHAARISGRVLSEDGARPLPFCAIHLEAIDRSAMTTRDVLAGAAGSFVLEDLAAGRYRLEFSYLGHRSLLQEVSLRQDDDLELLLTMEIEAIQMREYEVRSDREAREADLQTGFVELDASVLRRIPAFAEADPVRALQFLPGVQTASDISSGLYIRGGGPDQNLVLLDEVPIYNPTHAFGLFSSFHPDLIEGLTLFKGAYPARYGGRLGAVLDVESLGRSTEELHGRAAVSTVAARALLQGSNGGSQWSLGARRTYLDPLLTILRRSEPSVPSYYFYDANARVSRSGSLGTTEVRGYFSRDDLRLDADESTSIDIRWGNSSLTGSHRFLLGGDRVGTLRLWYSEYRTQNQILALNTPIEFNNRLLDLSARAELAWRWGPRHRLSAGAGISSFDFEYTEKFNFDTQLEYRTRPVEISGFVEDDWSLSAATALRSGFRTAYFSDGERTLLEPRLALRHRLSEKLALKLGTGLYHQYVQLITTEGFSAGDLYLPIDETTKPGRSIQSVLGAEWTPSPLWKGSAEIYAAEFGDLVSFDNTVAADRESLSSEDVFYTQGEGWAAGIELFAERRMGALTGWLGYTLGWTRRRFEEINRGESFPPKYDRRHDLSAVVQWQKNKWELGASFVYGTGQAFTPASARYAILDPATGQESGVGQFLPAERNSARLLPYHRLDVSVARSFNAFGRAARWNLQLFNLYSRRNDWFVQYDEDEPGADPTVVQQLPLIPSLGLEFEF